MRTVEIKMKKRVDALDRHFGDGINRLLIDRGNEKGGRVEKSLMILEFLLN